MKNKIIKSILFSFLFLLFLIGWILELILIIDYFNFINSGGSSYAYLSTLNIEIPSVLYRIFGSFLLLSTLGSYIGYKTFFVIKILIKELLDRKEKRAQAKAERAEETKQAKIKALEAELEELKKD